MAKKYTVTDGKMVLVLEEAKEGGYVVTSPFNPDILTQAETIKEAFVNAYDVQKLMAEHRADVKKKSASKKAPARRSLASSRA